MDDALYVDNFIINYQSKYIHILEYQLKLNMDKISRWATNNSFRFSKSKPQCVHNNPAIKLKGTKISIVNEYKFLDGKLSFILHLKHL